MKAMRKNIVLAESDDTIVVEGNYYFPADSLNREYFQKSDKHTICSWKGEASYYHIATEGDVEENAAWYYPESKEKAKEIKGYVAFYNLE